MKNCYTSFWTAVSIIAFLIVLFGLFISITKLIEVEAKVDHISTVLSSWGVDE